jgi:hypothetical protein
VSSRGVVTGTCRVGLENGELSFEHVPPRKAYNSGTFTPFDTLERLQGRRVQSGPTEQGGIGSYAFCHRCNNKLGTWYGGEYVKWAWQGVRILNELPADAAETVFTISRRYPLRFLKQAVALFFATNPPGFARANEDLRRFVMDRDRRCLPPKYDLYMTLVRGPFSRITGVFGTLNLSGHHEILSEVAHAPFAFMLALGTPRSDETGRINWFGEYGYRERRDVAIRLKVGETASPVPGDYRTQAQLPVIA